MTTSRGMAEGGVRVFTMKNLILTNNFQVPSKIRSSEEVDTDII